MTRGEAIKLMLGGHKVTNNYVAGKKAYIYYDDNNDGGGFFFSNAEFGVKLAGG